MEEIELPGASDISSMTWGCFAMITNPRGLVGPELAMQGNERSSSAL